MGIIGQCSFTVTENSRIMTTLKFSRNYCSSCIHSHEYINWIKLSASFALASTKPWRTTITNKIKSNYYCHKYVKCYGAFMDVLKIFHISRWYANTPCSINYDGILIIRINCCWLLLNLTYNTFVNELIINTFN